MWGLARIIASEGVIDQFAVIVHLPLAPSQHCVEENAVKIRLRLRGKL
jgi:hypothetical protein